MHQEVDHPQTTIPAHHGDCEPDDSEPDDSEPDYSEPEESAPIDPTLLENTCSRKLIVASLTTGTCIALPESAMTAAVTAVLGAGEALMAEDHDHRLPEHVPSACPTTQASVDSAQTSFQSSAVAPAAACTPQGSPWPRHHLKTRQALRRAVLPSSSRETTP